jgi:RecA/RadA recombinase
MAKKKKSSKKKSTKKKKKKQAKKKVDESLGVLGTKKLFSPVRERMSCGMTVVDAIMGGPTKVVDGKTIVVPSDGTAVTAWGLPIGRIIEVIGGYSTGKSTFVENVAKQVQQSGGDVFMGITEFTLDPERMRRIGVDTEAIHYNEFEYIEDGFEWLINVLTERTKRKEKPPFLVTWDTVGASHSKDERPGSGGREVREGLRKITNLVARANAIMIFVNQTSATFDKWETEPATPFGMGIRFHASIRLEFKGQKKFLEVDGVQAGRQVYTESKAPYGIQPVVSCRKNKTFPPFRRCRMPVTFNGGLDDDFGMFLYLSQRKSNLTVTAPTKDDAKALGMSDASEVVKAYGNVITFKMDPPQACYWNGYRAFLQENSAVRDWMVDRCRKLAYNGFDPIAS